MAEKKDEMVCAVQEWLNNTFPEYFRYDETGENSGKYPVEPDGMTGHTTVTALIMALQLHYNLDADGVWGTKTSNACPVINSATNDEILLYIVQGGFICKGYDPNGFDGVYGPGLQRAINTYKADLGIVANNAMEQDVLKSLLTTDAAVLVASGRASVRAVQQFLNKNYYSLFKTALGYLPTGGLFERKTAKALIYAFQSVIGTTADGAIGTNTFNAMPSITVGHSNTELNRILQCALICNGIELDTIDGNYTEKMATKITEYQKFMCLDIDPSVSLGSVNRRTWGALFLSKGDPDRKANALDCVHQLTEAEARSLYTDGYRYVGRYLTKVEGGLNKNLTTTEIDAILSAGLHIFPIFQETNSSIDAFTEDRGRSDAVKAASKAAEFRFPLGNIIYFAVDFDATEAQTKNQITDYFKGVSQGIGSDYLVGIYGSRNICDIICKQGLAVSSFVSDMSTGYSGNLGFAIPNNWAFDQFATVTYSSGSTSFAIDKDMASGRDSGVFKLDGDEDYWSLHLINWEMIEEARKKAVNVSEIIPLIRELEDLYFEFKNVDGGSVKLALDCCQAILHYLFSYKYGGIQFSITLPGDVYFEHYLIQHPSLKDRIEEYIREVEIELDDKKYIQRYTLLKDNDGCLFELPHLAAVLAAYTAHTWTLETFAEITWFGWAGDMATALNEITNRVNNYPNSTALEHARDRIGEMEPEIMEKDILADSVLFNYCDIYADSDGVGLAKLIDGYLSQNSNGNGNHTHLFSEALTEYYTTALYHNRHKYLLEDSSIAYNDVESIKAGLKDLMTSDDYDLLLTLKATDYRSGAGNNADAIMEACCQAYAEWLMHEL